MRRGSHHRIGCCISGHGFGHAARTAAVLQALAQRIQIDPIIVSNAPSWIFTEALASPCSQHPASVDVGLIQLDALEVDPPATLAALDDQAENVPAEIERIAALLEGCRVVLCDIAPLGIAAAKRAGIPSVLIENFTWDWIYQEYVDRWPRFRPHIDTLAELLFQADYRIQAKPVCQAASCDLVVDPVARFLRHPEVIRQRLSLEASQKMVLLTMGGSGGETVPLSLLRRYPEAVFVLPGLRRENHFEANLRFVGREGAWYHPDLVAASDLVIGKLGYSTVAEAWQAGSRFAYIPRRNSREAASLAAFVHRGLPAWRIDPEDWPTGGWLNNLAQWLAEPRSPSLRVANGAEQTAEWMTGFLGTSPGAISRQA